MRGDGCDDADPLLHTLDYQLLPIYISPTCLKFSPNYARPCMQAWIHLTDSFWFPLIIYIYIYILRNCSGKHAC